MHWDIFHCFPAVFTVLSLILLLGLVTSFPTQNSTFILIDPTNVTTIVYFGPSIALLLLCRYVVYTLSTVFLQEHTLHAWLNSVLYSLSKTFLNLSIANFNFKVEITQNFFFVNFT